MNELVRDLDLPKNSAELLASRLKDRNLLASGTVVSFYRNKERDFVQLFRVENKFVFCDDINGLSNAMGCEYEPAEWRRFIDSSKRILKCVLLHNGNAFASMPIGHSLQMKESYGSMKQVPEKLKYSEHNWKICRYLKIVCMLLGQRGGYTKYPCFLCLWDSRAKEDHWVKQDWPKRTEFVVGEKNIKYEPLVKPEKVLLPPLQIKLGLVKQLLKTLDKEADCFKYLCVKFCAITEEKIKAGVFDGPQIRGLMNDPAFISSMQSAELDAWNAFATVVTSFLGNTKPENYRLLVGNLLQAIQMLGCNMIVKSHFLHSHVDYFPNNFGAVREEQGERFHQDIKTMKKRYQGYLSESMMADYCWCLIHECMDTTYSEIAKQRKLLP